ncbi:DUF1501 domain-containing protein [Stratiformator vulcanicus]|uniref:Sulfatase n=1 Tax=Stratiformator vulcanicus TaxID=2527980 RepID=A0A517QYE4_9PLAN|nr:DUF1501 domain-containing protein [Stratiformator vulcanicus]QDT36614.1 hypothetical protein Pan189_09740 [Stratiformator vulcanicus]
MRINPYDRRTALKTLACGFGNLALCGMAARRAAASNSASASAPSTHFVPKAKRIIFLFMQGGPSQVDTFDYKPELNRRDGENTGMHDARMIANTGKVETSNRRLMGAQWKFRQYGESGLWASDLFPETAQHADDMCVVHSMHSNGIAHGPSTLFLHCGSTNLIRPSMGSWISYGLGVANENLPAFVTICPSRGNGGARNYGTAFLPPVHQAMPIGSAGKSFGPDTVPNLANDLRTSAQQREFFDFSRRLHQTQMQNSPTDSVLDAELNSLELAWRMQNVAPDLLDVESESEATKSLYGLDQKETRDYGRQCLLARRLAEEGVRYIQVTHGDPTANPKWDQHSNIERHEKHARAVDRPIAGLLTDLKRRGLLDDTIVWWGGEFGRTPYAQGTGRDHNAGGFTHFLAGGGFRGGHVHGATDEFGHLAVEDKVHMHDMHATLLAHLGLDHEQLTYRHEGRDFRLTDVHGRIVSELS